MVRISLVSVGILVSLLVLWLIAVRFGVFNPSEDYLAETYTDERSRFVMIDGVRLHVVEEGQGPVIILIHGYLGSNRQWEGWAERLRQDFRVVRFDFAPFGLSGPDPTEEYGVERAMPLFEGLVEELGYEHFHLGGTSSGSIMALRYAAKFPDRVDKLLLSTVPAYTPGDRVAPPWQFRSVMWISDNIFKVWRPKLYWRLFLENIFGNDDRIKPEMVQGYADLNNRKGNIPRVRQFIMANARSEFDLAEAASRITASTLLQWAGQSPVLTADGLNNVLPLFTSTEVKVIRYPGLGHQLMLEDPETTVSDARAFLMGGEP
ncbi:MAG: alpha/beta hydrolase [Rhodospirillaceae bacterium]